jgi:hypothetical protein
MPTKSVGAGARVVRPAEGYVDGDRVSIEFYDLTSGRVSGTTLMTVFWQSTYAHCARAAGFAHAVNFHTPVVSAAGRQCGDQFWTDLLHPPVNVIIDARKNVHE